MDEETMIADMVEDIVQPFKIESSGLHGRAICLSSLIDEIVVRHEYPPVVAYLVAETITVAVLLASLLKYQGVFTLQLNGDGMVPFIAVDVAATGGVRAYAKIAAGAEDSVAAMPVENAAHLVGKGHMTFTVNAGPETDIYQQVFELLASGLKDSVRAYFRQSADLDTGLVVAVEHAADGWHSRGILVQKNPDDDDKLAIEADAGGELSEEEREDAWRRAMMLLSTCTPEEMLDRELSINMLLFRLFHEEGVRVYDVVSYKHACHCSREKVINALAVISKASLDEMKGDDEVIHVTCEFCNEDYVFNDDDISALYDNDDMENDDKE